MPNTPQLELAIAERATPLLLVVDDDPVLRGMLKTALQRHQYDVIEAPNGAEAIEIFRNYRPDMVLLDVLMPVMNGYETCEAIRKLDPERTVPVLMLTGLDDVESIDRAFDAGATDFITKPINWSLFAQRVRYALQARNMDFALRKSQHRIRYALQVAKLGYWDWDLKSNHFNIPANVLYMLGIDNGDNLQLSDLLVYIPDEDKDKVERAFIDARDKGLNFALEHRVATSEHNQHYVFQQCDVITDDDGKPRYVLGTIQDISALKRAEDMILHQAYHDQLTDLPNQTLYKDRLYHALKVAEHSKKKVAVILLDIDRFQVINESLGHDAGDMLLVEFAGFLNRLIQESDTVSRISGNEFALLLESVNEMDEVHEVIRNIRQSLYDNAFGLAGEQVYIKVSMGIALYPDDDFNAEGLMQYANAAMRKAKAQGGDQECFYTTNMNRRVHDRLRMERDLRLALEQDQLEIFYQPQVSVNNRKIVAAEALVRWNHPEQGNIPPFRFVPLAEETGLIHALGRWVLHKAICQTREWHDQGHTLRVGINLSARQFMQKDLVQQVEQVIEECGLSPEYIDLEITESIAMQDAENSIKKMHALKQLGINLSMDDFGTGYSSLSYLHQFPLDVLKIDRSFVKGIMGEGNKGEGAIARAVLAMAQSMGLEVVAEGVETEQQFQFLKQYGCHIVQGYLISQPLNTETFSDLLMQT